MVERCLAKANVASSNLVSRSIVAVGDNIKHPFERVKWVFYFCKKKRPPLRSLFFYVRFVHKHFAVFASHAFGKSVEVFGIYIDYGYARFFADVQIYIESVVF